MTKKELELQNELLLDEVKFLRKQIKLLAAYDFNSKQQYHVTINPQPPLIDLTPKITWFSQWPSIVE